MTDEPADETDVLIIGGGPGGYVTAIRAGQTGHDVVLVTDEAPGGTCLNHGCIPSKALLSATGRVQDVASPSAERMGIYADPYVDGPELFAWKDQVVTGLTDGVTGLCKSNGVRVVNGHARFRDERTAFVETDDERRELGFEYAVVATGSRPTEIPALPYEDDGILDSRQALSLEAVPHRLIIVGGGYIGMELSIIFARLGTTVTVIEALETALPRFDDDITDVVVDHGRSLGIDFRFEESAEDYEQTADGVRLSTGSGSYAADAVLVAVGREPVTDTAGLDAAGVGLTDAGFVAVDEQRRTTNDRVFAVGDVIGGKMLAHEAMAEGERIAAVIEESEPPAIGPVPSVVFTEPEIGVVGHSVAAAEAADEDPVVGQFSFAASGRALAAGDDAGFAQLVATGDDGRIVGAQVVARHASDLISEATIAVQHGLTVSELAGTVHAHPTFSEAWTEAAMDAVGDAIHTAK